MNGTLVRQVLKSSARWLGNALAPPRCLVCAERTATHHVLCPVCWNALPLISRPFCERLGIPFAYYHGPGMLSAEAIAQPPAYGQARAATRYEAAAIDLVHQLKYGDRVDMADLMGGLMAQAGADLLRKADVIVPVPLHRWRLWGRRFNQSVLLGEAIARRVNLPVDAFLLLRTRWTRQQVGQSRVARASNVQGAFKVSERARGAVKDKRIVLVDDVLTSGATVEAATRALTRAGAANVDVLVFSRVINTVLG